MLIYVSHPYGGKEENKITVEQIIKALVKNDKQNTYVSPIHTFGYMYDEVDYKRGLEMCLELLDACDCMIVFGDYKNSIGCKEEIQHCVEGNKPHLIRSSEVK